MKRHTELTVVAERDESYDILENLRVLHGGLVRMGEADLAHQLALSIEDIERNGLDETAEMLDRALTNFVDNRP